MKAFFTFLKKNMSIRLEWRVFAVCNVILFFVKNANHLFARDRTDFRRARDFFRVANRELKAEALKKELELESRELVDKIIERQEYIYTHNLLNTNKFKKDEKNLQKTISIKKYKKKYSALDSFPIETFIYHNGLKFLPRKSLTRIKNKDVIDAGAFIGDSAIVFSEKYAFRKIYSFEPEQNNLMILKNIVNKYNLSKVIAVNNALGEKNKTLKIKNGGLGAIITNDADGQMIDVITIDNYVREHELNVGLIKMDIEGAEYSAILGALETIKNSKPVLLISIYHTAKDFFEIKPLLQELNPDYKFIIRKINPFSLVNEVVLIAY